MLIKVSFCFRVVEIEFPANTKQDFQSEFTIFLYFAAVFIYSAANSENPAFIILSMIGNFAKLQIYLIALRLTFP